jgi:hypothetical protein
MIEPGAANTDTWTILGQFHNTDIAPKAPNPPFGFALYGEKLYPFIYYMLPGQTTNTNLTFTGIPIQRGQYDSIQIEANFSNTANGFVQVWVNGTEVVNYHGPVGYGQSVYWKEGIYRDGGEPTLTNTMSLAVDYNNLQITTSASSPGAPVITGDTTNGAAATLVGTSVAGTTIAVFDGTSQMGTATANGNGLWTFTTGQLSTGTHTFTATATDPAGSELVPQI